MWKKAQLDRIVDGAHAVLLVAEGRDAADTEHVVPASFLPEGTPEGAWLQVRFDNGNIVEVVVDAEETERVRRRIYAKLQQLRERGVRRRTR